MHITSKRKWTGIDVDIGLSLRNIRHLAQENKSVLLTAVGVAGVISSNILSFRAGYKASELIDEEAQTVMAEHPDLDEVDFHWKEELRLVWQELIPPIGVGGFTIAAIIAANRIDAQKAAGLAAAYSLSEKAFTEYREKVVEKIGENKERAVRDDIAQDKVSRDPVKEVIITGNGDVLFKDGLSGRYFESSIEKVRRAENEINFEIVHHMYDSLSHFYELIGLPPTAYSDTVGWNIDQRLEVQYSTTISSDDRPCMVIDFLYGPFPEYARLHS